MSRADAIKARYRAVCQEIVTIRRFVSGSTGNARPFFDAAVRGRAAPYEGEDDLIGGIVQGDQKVIVLVEDLIAKGLVLPVTMADKIRVKGKNADFAVMAPAKERKALDGTVVAYELQCRG